MSKGGHKDPSQLTGTQQAAVNLPIYSHPINPYSMPASPLLRNPGLFGLAPGAGQGPLPIVSQLNFGSQPGLPMSGLFQRMQGMARGAPMGAGNQSLFNPWGTRGYTP